MASTKEAVSAAVKVITSYKNNLFQQIFPKQNYGVGLKVQREYWKRYPEPCYWEIQRVVPKGEELRYGKAFGVLTWRGKTEERSRKIRGPLKQDWSIVDCNKTN